MPAGRPVTAERVVAYADPDNRNGPPDIDGRPVVFDLVAPLGPRCLARRFGYFFSFLGFQRLEGVILMVLGLCGTGTRL